MSADPVPETPKHVPIQSTMIDGEASDPVFRTYTRLVKLAWAHDYKFTDYMSMPDLQRRLGLDRATVFRHIRQLKAAGALNWHTDGKNRYRFFILEVRLAQVAKSPLCDPSSGGGINSLTPDHVLPPPDKSQTCDLRSQSCDLIDHESWQALREAGVGEPARSELADLPHVTARYIRAHAAGAAAEGVGIGALIFRIRNDWPAPDWCERCGGVGGHTGDCPTQAERMAKEMEREAERKSQGEAELERWNEVLLASRVASNADFSIHCQDGQDYTAIQILNRAMDELRLQMTTTTYQVWLGRCGLAEYDIQNGQFVIGVHNDHARDWLQNRLVGMVNRTLTGIIGIPTEARFVVWDKRKES